MKNYLLVCVALLMFGCSKSRTGEEVQPQGNLISFKSNVATVTTRAIDATNETLHANGLSVYGNYYTQNLVADEVSASFTGTLFSTGSESSPLSFVWNAENQSYLSNPAVQWPSGQTAGEGVDFIAFDQTVLPTAFIPGNRDNIAPSATFTQTTIATTMKDFLVAVSLGNRKSPGAIVLPFRHVLTKVSLTAQLSSSDNNLSLAINSVKAKAVLPSGSYAMGGVNNKEETESSAKHFGTWTRSGSATDVDFVLANNTTIAPNTTTATNITATNGALMVIPGAAYTLEISFSLTSSQEGSTPLNRTFTFTPTGNWEPGNAYVYNVKVSPNGNVVFDSSVEEWKNNDSSDVTAPTN